MCKLCQNEKKLCDSHALPMAMFRQILRKKESSGKLIVTVDDQSTPVFYSSDSWSTCLLCSDCERLLNEKYDLFGISFFQGSQSKPIRSDEGVYFHEVNAHRVRMFILSIVWRMHVSEHESYRKVILPNVCSEELRLAFLGETNIPKNFLHIKLSRLHDMGPGATLDIRDFTSFIIAPFSRVTHKMSIYAICFILFGFFVEIFVPRIPAGNRAEKNIINERKRDIFAPFVQFSDIPEILSLAVNMLRKDIEGISKIKQNL